MRNKGSLAQLMFVLVCLWSGLWLIAPVSAANQPDLIVESFTFSPANPTTIAEITFTGVIKNAGTAAAAASKAQITLAPNLFDVPQLAPGARHTVTYKIKLDKAQNYGTTFTVDKSGTVKESNETNNSKQIHFTVIAIKPNLIVQSFVIIPASATTDVEVTMTGITKKQQHNAGPGIEGRVRRSDGNLQGLRRALLGAQWNIHRHLQTQADSRVFRRVLQGRL